MVKIEKSAILRLAAVLFILCSPGFSQIPPITDAEIHQAVLDVTSGFTLMVVGAHPDDEFIEAVTYYRKKYGARVVVVIASRGEGGQNEIGPELYEDLAVIRSREMREAERLSGGEYYNLNFVDFGYSKRIDETYEKWGREEILRRLVRLIRELQPHVILTNHDSTTGHSNHQAVGAQLYQAFFAAADSSIFPEQFTNGLGPWQPQRLFWWARDYTEANVTLEVGERHPYLDSTYARLAAQALRQHRSQGMDIFAQRITDGPRQRYYRLVAESASAPRLSNSADFFVGLQNDWVTRLNLQQTAQNGFSRLQLMRDPHKLSRDQALLAASQFVSKIDSSAQHGWQWQRLNDLLAMCLGLSWGIEFNHSNLVPGENIKVEWVYAPMMESEKPDSHLAVVPEKIKVVDRRLYLGERQVYASAREFEVQPFIAVMTPSQLAVPSDVALTFPRQQTIYQKPRWQEAALAECVFEWNGIRFRSQRTVSNKEIEILPHIQIETPELPVLFFRGGTRKHVAVPVAISNNTSKTVKLEVGLYRSEELLVRELVELDSSAMQRVTMRLSPDAFAGKAAVELECRVRALSQPNLRIASYPSRITVAAIQSEIPKGLKVGIVASYDTTLSWFFRQAGIPYVMLSDEDLEAGQYHGVPTVVLDMRAYLVRSALRENNEKVLQWIAAGGHAITLYHKTFEWNLPAINQTARKLSPADLEKGTFAPYSLRLGIQRVADENAMALVTEPKHMIFNFPNRIVAEDWRGWVQERGLYFPDDWDNRYHSLVEFADPNEMNLGGSMLFTEYGRGTFIYSALVWYRQLRIAHAGAIRLFINMLAVPLGAGRRQL